MKIQQLHTDSRGDRWAVVGYSNSRIFLSDAGTYRLIRERDGARVRIHSNKFYWLDVAASTLDSALDVPDGHDEAAQGGGAAKLADDIAHAAILFAP